MAVLFEGDAGDLAISGCKMMFFCWTVNVLGVVDGKGIWDHGGWILVEISVSGQRAKAEGLSSVPVRIVARRTSSSHQLISWRV